MARQRTICKSKQGRHASAVAKLPRSLIEVGRTVLRSTENVVMSSRTGRARLLLPVTLFAVALCGCSGITQNPSYFPALLPFGDIVRTHPKPPGLAYFTNFDPHACKLVVRPVESCSPAQTQHVLIATVY